MVVTERIPVPFRGGDAGEGPLTWAQRDVVEVMARTGRTMNIGGAVPLPPGETIRDVTTLFRFLVERHPSLRTRVRVADDGTLRQVVSAAGELTLEIVDVADDDDPAEVTEATRVRHQLAHFDREHEWPVRMAAIRHRGALTHLVVMYHHLVVDGFGLGALVADMVHLDRATGTATAPPAGTTALELAERQATPAEQRHSARSLRHWEALLRAIPPHRYTGPRTPEQPRIWEFDGTSPAMLLAARAIAARTGAPTSAVLLAAAAVALAAVTGVRPSVLQVLVGNRFRPGLAEAVSNVRQFGLCVIDVTGPFDEVVGRARAAAMSAYKHGYYDTVAHLELLDRIGEERGAEIDISCYVNDRRGPDREETGPAPTATDVCAALARTRWRWGVREDTYDGTFYLHFEDVPDAVELAIFADTGFLAPERIEACARAMEAVVVTAVLTPAEP
ncbi:hypothetical protein GCM10009682_39060 [Luedemannella flava]|uniref:Condensation domain-containing protein n=1 Tax=Luedemannella flava TaxID=349316 RepID=A0ABN2M7Y5_9ACTN